MSTPLAPDPQAHHHRRVYRYYDMVMAAFITLLVCSDLIGVNKVATVRLPLIGEFTFGAAILFFPISYLFGDILTEVYGYARARRVVWMGFGALVFTAFMSWVVVNIPPSPGWKGQEAYEFCFGSTPRIIFASLLAFWAGEFANSYTLAKMKIWTRGRFLWTRIVGSTVVGEFVDSAIFYPLAFLGSWPLKLVIEVMISNYLLKVLWEVVNTPITYRIVAFLKRAEQEDYYDYHTNFTPFSLKT